MIIHLETGASAYARGSEPLTDLTFGTRFTSYTDLRGFLDQINGLDIGLIVWPGGTLAETETDRYGLEYNGLYAPGYGQARLDDMIDAANDNDAALSVLLPTHRYIGDHSGLRRDLRDFLGDLLGGDYGTLPDRMILEIGNEYFAHFGTGADAAGDYAKIANIMVTEIALALADPAVNTTGADLSIAVQTGKTMSDDEAIRDGLSDFALSNVDMITHHRFPHLPQGFDSRIDRVENIVEAWEDDVKSVGGAAPDLFVSAYNTAALTRNDALQDYLDEHPDLTADDVDLDGRTTTGFEKFWQAALTDYAYGAAHPGMILEAYASYAEAGMDAGAVFGTDFPHPGRLSYETPDGTDHQFAGGAMMEMIYESVGGTRVLESEEDYDPGARLTTYAFENKHKLVVFLSAGDKGPGEVTLDLDGLGSDYLSLWAESLTARTDPDWMDTFGIPDNPKVDESPEAETYASGIRTALNPEISASGVTVDLSANEVVRLAFAKTEHGADEIASWSDASEVDLTGVIWDESGVLDDGSLSADEIPDMDFADDGGFGSAIGAVLLLPLMLFV